MADFEDQLSWKDNWVENGEITLPSGGQGAAKAVWRKSAAESQTDLFFMKILNSQNSSERRARFFQEASAYSSFSHRQLPRLVESNAHKHKDLSYKLYMVTEFIKGETLSELVEKNGHLSFELAVEITFSFLDVLGYCHSREYIHRDIKPDNIIVDEKNVPHLLDFGLVYKFDDEADSITDIGQEIGNRFLRVPELSLNSEAKRDRRTDITFAGGILFYMLTGKFPATLLDESGNMPHQREGAAETLKERYPYNPFRMMNFFDKVFPINIAERYADCAEMEKALGELRVADEQKTEITLDDIKNSINKSALEKMGSYMRLYDLIIKRIMRVHKDLLADSEMKKVFSDYQTGYIPKSKGYRIVLGYRNIMTDKISKLEFFAEVLGEELVLSINKEAVFRTPVSSPKITDELTELVKSRFLQIMKQSVEQF